MEFKVSLASSTHFRKLFASAVILIPERSDICARKGTWFLRVDPAYGERPARLICDQALISSVREFVCLQLWWAPAARHAWTHGLWFMRLLRGGWLWHCCQDPETGGWTIERQIGPLWGSGIWGPGAEWAHCVPSVRGPAAPQHKLRKWDGAMRARVTVPLDLYDPCCSGSTNLWFCLLWIYKKTLQRRMCYIFLMNLLKCNQSILLFIVLLLHTFWIPFLMNPLKM